MIGAIHECLEQRRRLRKLFGTSIDDKCSQILKREKVSPFRGKKLSFTWSQIKRAYNKRHGICFVCGKEMALDRRLIHGDHINSQLTVEEGLNSEKNLAACHAKCNISKGAKSIPELSKETGKPYTELAGGA